MILIYWYTDSDIEIDILILPAVSNEAFQFVLVPPPPGGPGEGPDCHFPKEIDDFGPISARIRGDTLVSFFLFDLKYS